MTPDALPSEPRRRIHWMRWLIVLAVVLTAWGGWRWYDFQRAQQEAMALGWRWTYTDPIDVILDDWRAAFRKDTWDGGDRELWIKDGNTYLPNHRIVHRLNPRCLVIVGASDLGDLDTLNGLSSLQRFSLLGCTGITSIEPLKGLYSLQYLALPGCTDITNIEPLSGLSSLERLQLAGCSGITSIEPLKSLASLQELSLQACTGIISIEPLKGLASLHTLSLSGCTGITAESVAALKAALPGCDISGP